MNQGVAQGPAGGGGCIKADQGAVLTAEPDTRMERIRRHAGR